MLARYWQARTLGAGLVQLPLLRSRVSTVEGGTGRGAADPGRGVGVSAMVAHRSPAGATRRAMPLAVSLAPEKVGVRLRWYP